MRAPMETETTVAVVTVAVASSPSSLHSAFIIKYIYIFHTHRYTINNNVCIPRLWSEQHVCMYVEAYRISGALGMQQIVQSIWIRTSCGADGATNLHKIYYIAAWFHSLFIHRWYILCTDGSGSNFYIGAIHVCLSNHMRGSIMGRIDIRIGFAADPHVNIDIMTFQSYSSMDIYFQ